MRNHLCLLAVVLSACGLESSPQPPSSPGPHGPSGPGWLARAAEPVPVDPFEWTKVPGVERQPSLRSFTGANACASLEQEIEDRAVLAMHLQVSRNRKGALDSYDWYRNYYGQWADAGSAGYGGGAGGGAGGGMSGAGGAGGSGSTGPNSYTTTNTQVAGVDEADFVKNDGTRIFVLSGRTLYATSSWPAASLARRGALRIEGRPLEMFLAGDRLVVFSTAFDAAYGALPTWCSSSGYYTPSQCEDWYANSTQVTWVDASDLSDLRVVGRQRIPGTYETARRVGTKVRLVLRDSVGWGDGVTTYLSWDATWTKADLARAYDRLAVENEARIRARTLNDWLPASKLMPPGQRATFAPLDCSQVSVPSASAELGLASVVTLDLDDVTAVSRSMVLAQVDEVYANTTSLYLAHRHWWWSTANHQTLTYVYRFDTSQSASVRYVGAGVVEGTIVNQFSMDEVSGVLRLAVTAQDPNGSWNATRNRVVTLGLQAGALVELGRTADFGLGERMMSARFVGDTAYAVTFRQTDPLFTIDLSDPSNPQLLGELTIPGFSTYIHPIDATHLLTIGTYVPAQPSTWSERALQLSIFDVSDRRHPRQTFTRLVGTGYSWSEAQHEHKAFNYFPQRGLLAIPFYDWQYTYGSYGNWWSSYVSDLRVFSVDPATGFTSKGAIDMRDLLITQSTSPYGCWYWYWEPMVRRSVMADDFVYAISSGGVRVANVNDLSRTISTVTFSMSP